MGTSEPAVGCCSRDLGTCTHLDNSFCNANKENCEGPCGKVWLPSGDLSDTCLPLWEKGCVTDSDCCLWGHCSADGLCDHDGTWKPPTRSSTKLPFSRSRLLRGAIWREWSLPRDELEIGCLSVK